MAADLQREPGNGGGDNGKRRNAYVWSGSYRIQADGGLTSISITGNMPPQNFKSFNTLATSPSGCGYCGPGSVMLWDNSNQLFAYERGPHGTKRYLRPLICMDDKRLRRHECTGIATEL